MKKFWIVLLALALVAGFAMSAPAADVKFSGSYYALGAYADSPRNLKVGETGYVGTTALINQRLRINTEFKIAEGLMLVTRFDAIEKDWGDFRWRGEGAGRLDNVSRPQVPANTVATTSTNTTVPVLVSGSANAQESIEFERAYVDFTTKIGRFMVGYQQFIGFGTTFLDTSSSRAGIKYLTQVGPLTLIAAYEKGNERSVVSNAADADKDLYDFGFVYKFGAGTAGLMYQFVDNKEGRAAKAIDSPAVAAATVAAANVQQLHAFNPYFQMKFGPVFIEGEGLWGFGKVADFESAALNDKTLADVWALYLHAKADIGPAYVGALFAWATGDDPATSNTVEGGLARGLLAGQAWDPCLILYNDALGRANGAAIGAAIAYTPNDVFFDNAKLVQLYVGFKPVKEADIMMSATWVQLDKKNPATNFSGEVGTEIDFVAKYKIFDNLEYMFGAGYLIAGDYWKGVSPTLQVSNNYLLLHKLTLSF